MTGYTVHTGSTEKFSQGWDEIFGNQKKTAATEAKSGVATPKKKAAPAKAAASAAAPATTGKKTAKSVKKAATRKK